MFKLDLLAFITVFLLFSGCSSSAVQETVFERKHYNTWEKDIGYSQVIRVGNTLHVAGITGDGDTFGEQLESIYDQIEKILSDYGADTSNISKEVIYTTDMKLLREAIPLRKKYYPDELYPSASWVQVNQLFAPDLMLEVEVTVELPL